MCTCLSCPQGCRLFSGAVAGSVFARELVDCECHVAARQLRIHDSTEVVTVLLSMLYVLLCLATVILKKTVRVLFSFGGFLLILIGLHQSEVSSVRNLDPTYWTSLAQAKVIILPLCFSFLNDAFPHMFVSHFTVHCFISLLILIFFFIFFVFFFFSKGAMVYPHFVTAHYRGLQRHALRSLHRQLPRPVAALDRLRPGASLLVSLPACCCCPCCYMECVFFFLSRLLCLCVRWIHEGMG